jgi:hypothetical protein
MPIPLFLLDRINASALSGAHVADQGDAGDCAINIEYVGERELGHQRGRDPCTD